MYYPVFVSLNGRKCVVFGGGRVAERKVRALAGSGAAVTCVSADFHPALKRFLAKKGKMVRKKIVSRKQVPSFLRGAFLAVAATSSRVLNHWVYEACAKRNLLVNAVDDPKNSNFIVPSVLRRGPLTIAVSTGGASPEFAKTFRRRLEKSVGPEYGAFLGFMSREREKIIARFKTPAERKKVFVRIVESGLIKLFKDGDRSAVRKKYLEILKGHGTGS